MAAKKKIPGPATLAETESWLFKLIETAPRPLPAGRFPQLLAKAQRDGCKWDLLMDVLDLWLNYNYCRIVDPISQDIELTGNGEMYFYK